MQCRRRALLEIDRHYRAVALQAFDAAVQDAPDVRLHRPTREAARAVQAALPLLRAARLVHVVAWGADAADSAPALMRHLAQHGVTCRPDVSRAEPPEAGDALLSRAAELDADLLVMGCYGHSRAREWIAGGVTRTVLATMTLPTLMAH